ncbi:MAG: hypothetical protein GY834_01900 [Bacteroidetes bacterium]|nr:hypothetical protein [Bacteroidota bacterium]
MTEHLQKHVSAYNQKLIGKTVTVLVVGINKKAGFLSGLTEEKINIRFKSNDTTLTGNFCEVK